METVDEVRTVRVPVTSAAGLNQPALLLLLSSFFLFFEFMSPCLIDHEPTWIRIVNPLLFLFWLWLCFTQQNGYTALSFAAINSHIEVVAMLLENGADIDAVDTVSRCRVEEVARHHFGAAW